MHCRHCRCNEKVSDNPAQGWVTYTLERYFAGQPAYRTLGHRHGCLRGRALGRDHVRLRRYFDIIEYKSLDGTILQFLLADIAGNFQRDDAGRQLLAMLFHIEDTLMAAGALDSDFAYIVAAPRQLTP